MRFLHILILLTGTVCISSVIQAQEAQVDSLITEVATNTARDTNRVNNLTQISSLLVRTYTDSARAYALEAATLAQNLDFKRGEATAYRLTGVSFGIQNDIDNSNAYFERAKKIAEDLGDEKHLATINASIGVNYARTNQFDLALIYYLEAVDNYEAYGNLESMGVILNNIGNLFLQQDLNDEALDYYERAEEVLEKVNNESTLALVYSGLATVKDRLGEYETAKRYAELSVAYSLKTKRYTTITHSYKMLGDFHLQAGDPDSALISYKKSLKYSEIIRNETSINSAKCEIASVYMLLGNFAQARKYLEEVLLWSETQPIIRLQELRALELMMDLESRTGNFDSALAHSMTLAEKKDSLHADEMALKISELETVYETEKKDAQIQLLEVENRVTTLYVLILGIVIFFVLIGAVCWYHLYYIKKTEERQIRLDAMKRELHQYGSVIAEKNKFISHFRDDLDEIRRHVHSFQGKKELTHLVDSLHSNIQLSEMDEDVLFSRIEQVNSGIFEVLRKQSKHITKRDERLASLVLMKLTNKDIANILHIEEKSVKQAKYRLKRKLSLERGVRLGQYLDSISLRN